MISTSNWVIILSILICDVSAHLPKYARCRLRDGTGLCALVEECQPILDLISRGAHRTSPPLICSQTEKTVCCPESGLIRKKGETYNLELTTDFPGVQFGDDSAMFQEIKKDPSDATIELIKRKCRQFGEHTYSITFVGSTMTGSNPIAIRKSKCEHSKSVSLIVGGVEAKAFEFPHQVLLGYKKEGAHKIYWACGGSLISPNFVLTAAHCLNISEIGNPQIARFGITKNVSNAEGIDFNISNLYPHPKFTRKTRVVNNDIALLKLSESVNINEKILPICLPTESKSYEKAIVTGFGKTENNKLSEKLLKVTLDEINHEACRLKWKGFFIGNYSMLCYGHQDQKKDSCSGDSGGPIQVVNNREVHCTYKQIGIVSFGPSGECGQAGIPGIYTNVYHYLDWIVGIVWKNETIQNQEKVTIDNVYL